MRKTMRYFVLALVLVLIAIPLLVVAVNSVDETLNTEAEKLIHDHPQPSPQDLRAFHFLLGLRSRADVPEDAGRNLWIKATSLEGQARLKFWTEHLPGEAWPSVPVSLHGVKPAPSAKWRESQEFRDALNGARPALAQYLQLLDLGILIFPPMPEALSPARHAATLLLKGHRWLTLHLAELVATGQWDQAQSLIRKENNFLSRLFPRATLLEAMIAHIALTENAQFLERESLAQPSLQIAPETLTSFTRPNPQSIIESTMKEEFRIFARVIETLSTAQLAEVAGEIWGGWTKHLPLRPLLKPNATVNKHFELTKDMIKNPGQESPIIENWAQTRTPWQWIDNPVGRSMVKLFVNQMSGQHQKLLAREAELREILLRFQSVSN